MSLILYILLMPLISTFVTYFLPKGLAKLVSTTLISISAVLSIVLFFSYEESFSIHLFQWIRTSNISFDIYVDRITTTMVMLIALVSALIHLYSIGYMKGDPSIRRFMASLSFFTLAMLVLVTSSNLIQMFIGWEGVGLASYLLIGFWFEKNSANLAAQKAFLVNRIGDFALLLAICIMMHSFATSDIQEVIGASLSVDTNLINLICLLLVVGAASKSAQVFLHVWLPDAMEGPTPVSALIHSATMVTAGVFLLCRLSPIMEHSIVALQVVTLLGAGTAFYASTVAIAQNDIKRIVAYSTCSQIGFMFIAVGVSAYPAAMFHLFTHGFFKALLFLCAGSVIIASHHEQDINQMGGLARKMPVTCILTWIGLLSLMGVPFFSGYYSKDMIMEVAFAANTTTGYISFVLAGLACVFTAVYSFRLLWLVFHRKSSQPSLEKVPWIMTLSSVVLALGAIFAGLAFAQDMIGNEWREFWGSAMKISHESAMDGAESVPLWVMLTPISAVLIALGLALGWKRFSGMDKVPALHNFLSHSWYFDHIYNSTFVKGTWKTSSVLKEFIETRLDKFLVDGLAKLCHSAWNYLNRLQDGIVSHYTLAVVVFLVLILVFALHL